MACRRVHWLPAAGLAVLLCGALFGLAEPSGGPVLPAEERFWSFEEDSGGWTGVDCTAVRVREKTADDGWCMGLSRSFPGSATLLRRLEPGAALDVNATPRVTYRVRAPKSAGAHLKTLFFLKNKDGLWYQCEWGPPLYPGAWTQVTFDLSPGSCQVRPLGHFRRWSNRAAAEIETIGVKVFSDAAFDGPVLVDAVSIGGDPAPPEAEPEPLAITDFRSNAERVPRFGKFELTFRINRSFANPFDPDEVVVDAVFTGPRGRRVSVPGFYYQGFVPVSRVTPMKMEEEGVSKRWRLLEDFVPVGPGCWKVRFTPTTVGTYTYMLRVVDRSGRTPRTLETRPRTFESVRSGRKGFLRVARDGRHFEFWNGEPFYPIGHNVHSSNDVSNRSCRLLRIDPTRPPDDRGLRSYADLFRKMGRNGENFVEVWMASWSLDIEWTARWKHYFGLGRYNLHHAWKLDRLLDLAEQNGLYVHLVLENHGKASTFVDPEWPDNPYNQDNGGWLRDPKRFFTSAAAREQYKKKLRYLVARWGYSPRILGFELWSEIDLVGNTWRDHGQPDFLAAKVEWHDAMTRYLKRIDHGRHLLTTHYSGSWARVQAPMVRLPGVDYIALDAYRSRGTIVQLLYMTERRLRRFGKPILVTEYGSSPKARGASLRHMEADLHAGIWAGYMLPLAGSPLLWWFKYVDRENRYFHYKALAAYARGEDRRNRGLVTVVPTVSGRGAEWVRALALRNDRSAYVWVFDSRGVVVMPDRRPEGTPDPFRHAGLSLSLPGFRNGAYTVEAWDTYAGRVLRRGTQIVEDGTLRITLPPFWNDVALKVRPSGETGRDNGTPRE